MVKKNFSLSTNQTRSLVPAVCKIAEQAGQILLEHYEIYCKDANNIKIVRKADDTPATTADYASQEYITSELRQLTPDITIVSEENKSQPDISQGDIFWTVDPLDGTSLFLQKNGQFFVKIALIDQNEPVLGVIYVPRESTFYFASRDQDSFKQKNNEKPVELKTKTLPKNKKKPDIPPLKATFKKQAATEEALAILRQRNLPLKSSFMDHNPEKNGFIMIMEGESDIHLAPGTKKTLEGGNGYSWDFGPLDIVTRNAGGIMVEVKSGQRLSYAKPADPMNSLIVFGDSRVAKKVYPELKL